MIDSDLFKRTEKNNKTIIIDSFIEYETFLQVKKSSLENLDGENLVDYVWYDLEEEHSFYDLCFRLINCASQYYDLSFCSGYEFWSQNNTRPKGWHYDKDEQLKHNTGRINFPICSMVYYIKVQNLKGGKLHLHDDIITPKENRLIIFPPATYHFVEDFKGERTSLLLNPWKNKICEQQIGRFSWERQKDTDGL